MTKDEQVAHRIHAALNLQAEALEQQSIVELRKEEPTELKQTSADTTEGGFEPGQCIVCEKPTCTRIQRQASARPKAIRWWGGEFQEYCCPKCYYQTTTKCYYQAFQNQLDVLVGGDDQESSDPEEKSHDSPRRESEDSDELQQTNADTTAVCCLCESSVPTTPLSLAFCESCSPITKFCKDFHVRGPQARIAAYYSIQRSRFRTYPPWNRKNYRRNPESDLEDECSTPSRRESEDSEDYNLRIFLTAGNDGF